MTGKQSLYRFWVRFGALNCLLFGLLPAVVRAEYQATVLPQPDVDQADSTITGTLAWHLLQAEQQGGGSIYLRDGVYLLRESLVIPDNTNVIGQSRQAVLKATGADFFDHLINNVHSDRPTADGVHNIRLERLTLIGLRDVRLNCIQLVGSEAARSSNIVLQNITTHHCGRHGIHIKGANNITLRNITSHHNGVNVDHDHNIYLLRVTGASVQNVYSYKAAGNGFSSTLLRQAELTNITTVNNGRRGIRFGAGEHITLRQCTANRNGLALDHQADGIVIVTDDYGNTSSDITISDCVIKRNRDYGFFVSNADGIVLNNNNISDNRRGNYHFIDATVVTN